MTPMERMIQLGLYADDAISIQQYFESRNDPDGLERYIANLNNFRSEESDR